MGESFIVRRGGSGKIFSALSVTYPEGSTCTCQSGAKTLKAKDTSGKFIFVIPKAGNWLVECRDDAGRDASKTVTIDQIYSHESIALAYEFPIFTNGEQNVPFSELVSANGIVKHNSDSIFLSYSGSSARNASIYTSQTYDFSAYRRLYVEMSITSIVEGNSFVYLGLRGDTITNLAALPDDSTWFALGKEDKLSTAKKIVEIDISNVGVARFQTIARIAKCYIYRIWAEA